MSGQGGRGGFGGGSRSSGSGSGSRQPRSQLRSSTPPAPTFCNRCGHQLVDGATAVCFKCGATEEDDSDGPSAVPAPSQPYSSQPMAVPGVATALLPSADDSPAYGNPSSRQPVPTSPRGRQQRGSGSGAAYSPTFPTPVAVPVTYYVAAPGGPAYYQGSGYQQFPQAQVYYPPAAAAPAPAPYGYAAVAASFPREGDAAGFGSGGWGNDVMEPLQPPSLLDSFLGYPQSNRNWNNWFQAWMEGPGFGVVGGIGTRDYWGGKGGWTLAQSIPDNFFCVLALAYGLNELFEGVAIARGSSNPDVFSGRSFAFPFKFCDIHHPGVRPPIPFDYIRGEQIAKGALQSVTAALIVEGALEGFIGNSVGYAVGLSAFGFSLPLRLCIHFIGKALQDVYDGIKLSQNWNNLNPRGRKITAMKILVNLITNSLAAVAFGFLAYGNLLGFVFMAGFALSRTFIQNRHRIFSFIPDAPDEAEKTPLLAPAGGSSLRRNPLARDR